MVGRAETRICILDSHYYNHYHHIIIVILHHTNHSKSSPLQVISADGLAHSCLAGLRILRPLVFTSTPSAWWLSLTTGSASSSSSRSSRCTGRWSPTPATRRGTRGEATVVSPLEGEGEDSNPSLQGSGEYERPPPYYYPGPK